MPPPTVLAHWLLALLALLAQTSLCAQPSSPPSFSLAMLPPELPPPPSRRRPSPPRLSSPSPSTGIARTHAPSTVSPAHTHTHRQPASARTLCPFGSPLTTTTALNPLDSIPRHSFLAPTLSLLLHLSHPLQLSPSPSLPLQTEQRLTATAALLTVPSSYSDRRTRHYDYPPTFFLRNKSPHTKPTLPCLPEPRPMSRFA
ncbi:hypothetical protein A1Q2_04741 [Trichosporon asahii var. asahii CBS 8904]|uniref:Uncharacterized protein n=1 Tax=Trichosporon asahii var. asahii (strain CBS 8904) TaxID=1220162 RepID=K1WHM7_TRIAC|nr:hypothetical protein A1Q2_04741 [Trichosporon asahii var. asahii CBS 8904]